MLNKAQKLILGIVLLVLVDIIWVSSSELSMVCSNRVVALLKHNLSLLLFLQFFLYELGNYNKPFFCTYFKTSMFTIYLVFLGLIAPWKESCNRTGNYAVSKIYFGIFFKKFLMKFS